MGPPPNIGQSQTILTMPCDYCDQRQTQKFCIFWINNLSNKSKMGQILDCGSRYYSKAAIYQAVVVVHDLYLPHLIFKSSISVAYLRFCLHFWVSTDAPFYSICGLVACETPGPWGSEAWNFFKELGRGWFIRCSLPSNEALLPAWWQLLSQATYKARFFFG